MENQDHPLSLYDSLSREVRQFVPQDPKNVTMYNCGPTVYSYAHIGNARAAVVADVLFRVLRHIYGEDHVRYARNLTDVDDRIIASAMEQGVPISEITEKYAKIYQDDLKALNCLEPTVEPKATEHIQQMADIIVTLMDKDAAYLAEGHIYFDVTKDDDYGKLSGRKPEDNLAGARVEVVGAKRNAADFVLWKPSPDGEPGWSRQQTSTNYFVDWGNYSDQPFANVPGRPGWHIECSAMAKETLGETIDIHCGGIDLKFPHHENEIAQSETCNGKTFANYWVHNEFLNMGKDKMSKSLGNVVLVHDLLKDWDGEVIRLALLRAHYRNELIWSEDLLQESKIQLNGWYRLKSGITETDIPIMTSLFRIFHENFSKLIFASILDDLKTPKWLAEFSDLNEYRREARKEMDQYIDHDEYAAMAKYDKYLIDQALVENLNLIGFLKQDPEVWFSKGVTEADRVLAAEYDHVRADAMIAKKSGDKATMTEAFKRADSIRDQLVEKGLVLETGSDGTSKLRRA